MAGGSESSQKDDSIANDEPLFRIILLSALCIAIGVGPAIINGFPIVYYDTNVYIGFPDTAENPFPPFYSIFVWLISRLSSLEFVVVAQSLFTAIFLSLSIRIGATASWSMALTATAAILLLTQLPWLASWIMPSWVGGLGLVSLIAFCLPRAGPRHTPLLLIMILAAALFATANFLVMAPLAIFFIWLRGRIFRTTLPRRQIIGLLAVLAAGAAVPVTYNAIINGKMTLAMGSSARLFSKLVDIGVAGPYLVEACQNGEQAACRIGAEVTQMTVREQFLWGDGNGDALADRTDAWNDRGGYFNRASVRAILANPVRTLMGGLRDARHLATKLTLSEGVELAPHRSLDDPVLRRIRNLYPEQTRGFLKAKQQRNALDGYFPVTGYAVTTLLSYGLCFLLLIFAWRTGDSTAMFLLIAAAAAMIWSILVHGGLSLPVPRYLVKNSWLATWAVIVAGLILFQRRDRNPEAQSAPSPT